MLVLGLGEMGRTTALQLAALGYRVSGWALRAREVAGIATSAGWAALPAALGAADVVVNLLPLTDDTRGLFDRHRLAQMRTGASLVNLARGARQSKKGCSPRSIRAGSTGRAATERLPFWNVPSVLSGRDGRVVPATRGGVAKPDRDHAARSTTRSQPAPREDFHDRS